jgi:hypothetical protein
VEVEIAKIKPLAKHVSQLLVLAAEFRASSYRESTTTARLSGTSPITIEFPGIRFDKSIFLFHDVLFRPPELGAVTSEYF